MAELLMFPLRYPDEENSLQFTQQAYSAILLLHREGELGHDIEESEGVDVGSEGHDVSALRDDPDERVEGPPNTDDEEELWGVQFASARPPPSLTSLNTLPLSACVCRLFAANRTPLLRVVSSRM